MPELPTISTIRMDKTDMNKTVKFSSVMCVMIAFAPLGLKAQTVTYSENFTGGTTKNPWYYLHGACLTGGTTAATVINTPGSPSAVAGVIPSCASMTSGSFYYNIGNA